MDCSASCLNRACRKLNKEVCRAVVHGLGLIIEHAEIHLDQPWLYKGDGVHLLDDVLEVFLTNLQRGLCDEIFGLIGGMEHS